MPVEKPVAPKRPARMMAILIAIFILGGIVLALTWKEEPAPPVSSAPASSAPKHNADPEPRGKP